MAGDIYQGSVTRFASCSWQQLFVNNVAGITCNDPRHKWGITKTGGLSNATGAERLDGRNSDTMTDITIYGVFTLPDTITVTVTITDNNGSNGNMQKCSH